VKTLLLGLGNELYGDDGVGLHVVRRLRAETEARAETAPVLRDVDMEECCLSGLALLEVIAGYDRLVIVDTIKKETPVPGKIHVLGEKDIRAIPGPSPHYVSIPQAIEIGRRIGLRMPRRICIVAVEAKAIYRLGEGLTAEMESRLPAIIRKVRAALRSD
jgi:hydrogenase maturation protease